MSGCGSAKCKHLPLGYIASLGMRFPQSKRAWASTCAVAVDRDVWRNADWVLQVDGMLGQMDLSDTDTQGTTWGLLAGVRYHPQTPWLVSAKLRCATVTESKIKDHAVTVGVLEVPSQNIPTQHLSWGWSDCALFLTQAGSQVTQGFWPL